MNKSRNRLIISFLVNSLLLTASYTQSAPYNSAYGPQAVMSPAASSSLNIPSQLANQQISSPNGQQSASAYVPGNGVYLSGQKAILNQASPIPQAPVIQPTQPVASFAQPYTNPYQSNNPYGQQMPSAMMQQQAYPSPYGQNGTYQAYKPQYGQPADLVQRNSAMNLGNSNKLNYRRNPRIVLNPDSNTGIQRGKEPNSAVLGILNGPKQTVGSGGMSNWFRRVFSRQGGLTTANNNPKAIPISNQRPLGFSWRR
ncbi:MAG: hypothetical protein QNJ31_04700 [Candidatus Caenarcaniphilales bacterium]|nr:hypothetical protein [Candidatus Caenarcaniphilales bacterium]